jgi:hypothetical protein
MAVEIYLLIGILVSGCFVATSSRKDFDNSGVLFCIAMTVVVVAYPVLFILALYEASKKDKW